MSFEVIIVGSGPAAAAAALGLRQRNVLILDVGYHSTKPAVDLNKPLYELKKTSKDLSDVLMGSEFESLRNVVAPYLSPKLKGPLLKFVTQDSQELCAVDSSEFDSVLSFAEGGLSNAWGAGVYRFNDGELAGFPIKAHELEPFYDELTKEIGICGVEDDLTSFFGTTRGLLPPVELDRLSTDLLKRYTAHKRQMTQKGIFIGKPRVALLTEPLDDRPAYDYNALEFFKPNGPTIYNAAHTIQKLAKRSNITLLTPFLVERYRESPEGVKVFAKNLKTDAVEEFSARKLVLAAGTISTSKIVLSSNNDHVSRLPILDNAVSYIPFFAPRFIGAPQEQRFFAGVQLNVVYQPDKDATPIQGSFYGAMGLLRSDLMLDLPLSIKGNLRAAKYLTTAVGVLYLLYPDYHQPQNYLQLSSTGELKIQYSRKPVGEIERLIISNFRRLGFLSLPQLCKYPAPGNSFHYAGSLPMNADANEKYTTSAEGRLSGTESVYVVDGSNFSSLPSKNHTLTIMANSMRIADLMSREL